ncbi:hypothetical protein IKG28_02730 [Candidatus Saccharibacteria bacterium]|nr:hypothetical protein [Candidatus Saccharibacteria bacterium]MBR3332515.1 hypothetical protein [Candidatus Saccharibacteria bacterium]
MSNRKEGFTLIELSLSIVFIALLSLSIVVTILNTVSAYRRGLTLNQINTVGMAVVDDMRAAVQNSSTRSLVNECSMVYTDNTMRTNCINSGAANFVSVKRTATVKIGNKEEKNVPVFGAFCTGSYSYIWNSGYFWAEGATVQNANKAYVAYNQNGVVKTRTDFRLLKIRDDSRYVCELAFKSNYNYNFNGFSGGFNISSMTIAGDPVELLENKEGNDMAIYDLSATAPAVSVNEDNMFYFVSFILGTTRGGANIKANGKSCAAPEDSGLEDFDYCAINKFNFAAQANGG